MNKEDWKVRNIEFIEELEEEKVEEVVRRIKVLIE
jgi:hypothetical protein